MDISIKDENKKKEVTIHDIMKKHAEKKAAAIERKAEREATGNVNKLIIERDATGLYYCRYSLSGRVPDALLGKFTHRQKILDIVNLKNIPLEE